MKSYIVKLKGTKKNNTQDIEVVMNCDNKGQCFSLAYGFFEKGETNTVFGTQERGLSTIHRWLPNAEELKQFAGKYKVFTTSIVCK